MMVSVGLSLILMAMPMRAVLSQPVDPAGAGGVVGFDIPSQPLESALLDYGHAANIQVLYDSSLLHGQRSSPVKGAYHAKEALELLLRGTGLRVRYASANAITLAAIGGAAGQVLEMQVMQVQGAPDVLDRRRMTQYAQSVENRISDALRRDGTTNRIAFDITLRLWIDPKGGVARVEAPVSSVDAGETDTILAAVRALPPGEPPPPNLPQPLSFRFRSRAAF